MLIRSKSLSSAGDAQYYFQVNMYGVNHTVVDTDLEWVVRSKVVMCIVGSIPFLAYNRMRSGAGLILVQGAAGSIVLYEVCTV